MQSLAICNPRPVISHILLFFLFFHISFLYTHIGAFCHITYQAKQSLSSVAPSISNITKSSKHKNPEINKELSNLPSLIHRAHLLLLSITLRGDVLNPRHQWHWQKLYLTSLTEEILRFHPVLGNLIGVTLASVTSNTHSWKLPPVGTWLVFKNKVLKFSARTSVRFL